MSFWNGREWVDERPPATDVKREGRVKHVAKAVLEAGLITALTFGLIAGTAFAAKGGGGGGGGGKHGGGGNTTNGGSIALVMVADANANGAPNWADTVTFNVSTTATTQPNVDLKCTQNGVVVYGATTGFYADYPWPWTQNMTLSSSAWGGGAASCTARLYAFAGSGTTTLATLGFTAGA
jgi:hypothetical protein